LEVPFWLGLKDIAAKRGISLSEIVDEIDKACQQDHLSSAIRVFVLDHYHRRYLATAAMSDAPPNHELIEAPKGSFSIG
jgi:predicted DNA-binding ribbon-helix-helix protein